MTRLGRKFNRTGWHKRDEKPSVLPIGWSSMERECLIAVLVASPRVLSVLKGGMESIRRAASQGLDYSTSQALLAPQPWNNYYSVV